MVKKPQHKLTSAEKRARRERRKYFRDTFEMISVRGKKIRVRRRRPLIDGMDPDEYLARHADPIWLHQNELWELLPESREQP